MGLDIAGAAAGAAAAFGGDLLGLSKPTKAKLKVKDDEDAPSDADPIECMFNPTEYSLSRSNTVQRNASPQQVGGTPHYSGSGPLSLTMQLFFDDFASLEGDVTPDITKLLTWTVPKDAQASNARPPKVGFDWGNPQLAEFWGYITSLRISYTVFRMDGTPVQAKVDLTVEEVQPPQDPPPTNPSSHAINSNRIRTLTEGETLQALAYRELGKATYWRSIAELNAIDDPMAVHAGQSLIMPAKADAAKQG